MGAWGVSSFENDDALDWLEELLASDGLLILYSAFEMLDEEFIECPDACNALAACEVVAALKGNARPTLPEQAEDWLKAHHDDDIQELHQMALRAIERITSEDSELNELWQESDEYDDWLADIKQLKDALSA